MASRVVSFLKGPHIGTVLALLGCIWEGALFVGPPLGVGTGERWPTPD